jgi:hypothetical protein
MTVKRNQRADAQPARARIAGWSNSATGRISKRLHVCEGLSVKASPFEDVPSLSVCPNAGKLLKATPEEMKPGVLGLTAGYFPVPKLRGPGR